MSLAPRIQRAAGYEKAIIRLPAYQFFNWDGKQRDIDELISAWYWAPLRPDPRDILRKEIALPKSKYSAAEITATIKRGHLVLAAMVAEHDAVTITKEGKVTCTCHPDQVRWIMPETLPTYYKED